MTANIVNLKVLTPPSFSSLLTKLSLRAPLTPPATAAKKTKETKATEWGRYYTVLQCSATYMDKFAGYEADQVNVVVDPGDNKIIVNVVSVDGQVACVNQLLLTMRMILDTVYSVPHVPCTTITVVLQLSLKPPQRSLKH